LYVILAAGGEARRVSDSETAVNSFHWAPDGKALVYIAAEPDSKALKDRKEKYGEFEIVHGDYAQNRLWLQPLDGKATVITPNAPFSVSDFDWSPDGKQIAFSAADNPSPGSSGNSLVYVMDIAGKSWKKLSGQKGPERNPKWSPDGKQIVYQTAAGEEFYFFLNDKLAVIPATGGTPHRLADDFDEDKQLITWSRAGIYFEAAEKTASYLFVVDPSSGAVKRVGEDDSLFNSSFSVTPDGDTTAFVRSSPTAFPEVFVSKTSRYAPAAVTTFGNQIKTYALAHREVVNWKSKDGTTIEGVLLKPHDFDPHKKYPLLVVVHGGPTGIDRAIVRPDRNYPVEQFVEKGALVLRPNYRGSAGYGEKMRSLNVRNLGVGDAWDVLSGVDSLISQGFVDPQRLGCMGWSQGGYISAFLTTSTNRFKAISVGAGISDWSTYYVNTDITPFTRQYLKATPWDDPEIYSKTSPITYVKNASTPTLIQHGELDKRVPIPNGYELRQALEDRGVPVKMIVYKGFGHGIDKPKQQRAVMEHNLEWFGKYIWGE
jgi:dipeptidyl aminopeptidase/acylaminoacyl peptidase